MFPSPTTRCRKVPLSALILLGMFFLLGILGFVIAGNIGVVFSMIAGTFLLSFTPRLPPHLVMRLAGARPLAYHDDPRLFKIVARLADRAKLPYPPKLYYVPSRDLNAFASGTVADPNIAITTGLYQTLRPREMVGVLAHEISHLRNNDLFLMNLARIFTTLTRHLSLFGLFLFLVNLPLLLFGSISIPLHLIGMLLLAPSLSALLELSLSRTREFQADRDAVELTGDPQGLASALSRLERGNRGFFEQLFRPRADGIPSWLRTHPPTKVRIERLLSEGNESRIHPVNPPKSPYTARPYPLFAKKVTPYLVSRQNENAFSHHLGTGLRRQFLRF